MANEVEREPYRCASCGCTDLPPLWRQVIAEYGALNDREKRLCCEILGAIRLYGQPKDRDWNNAAWDMIQELLPTYPEALEISVGLDRVLCYVEEDPDLLPPAWSPATRPARIPIGARDKFGVEIHLGDEVERDDLSARWVVSLWHGTLALTTDEGGHSSPALWHTCEVVASPGLAADRGAEAAYRLREARVLDVERSFLIRLAEKHLDGFERGAKSPDCLESRLLLAALSAAST